MSKTRIQLVGGSRDGEEIDTMVLEPTVLVPNPHVMGQGIGDADDFNAPQASTAVYQSRGDGYHYDYVGDRDL